MLMLRLMEQLEVVGMREKVIEVSDYFDVTLACKDAERISAQFCNNLSIYHCTSDLGGAEGQAGSLQEQMAAQGLSFYRKILSTGWLNIK